MEKLEEKTERFEITAGPRGHSGKVLMNGEDISRYLRGVECLVSVDQPTTVTLHAVAASTHLTLEAMPRVLLEYIRPPWWYTVRRKWRLLVQWCRIELLSPNARI